MNNTITCLKKDRRFLQNIFIFAAIAVFIGFTLLIQGTFAAVTPQVPTVTLGPTEGFINVDYTFGFNTTDYELAPESDGTYLTNIQDIMVGYNHSCALGTASGTPYCWGAGTSAQLGDGQSSSNRTTPVLVLKGAASGADTDGTYLINMKKITGGSEHTCALSNTGKVYCWGRPSSGQLGDGQSSTYRTAPVQVLAGAAVAADTDGTYLTNIKDVTAGYNRTCALSNSANVYCWGNAGYGQLGDGQNASSRLTPVRVLKGAAVAADTDGTYLTNIKKITSGQEHTCAVSNGGNAYCWGRATNGRLGNNVTSGNYFSPIRVLKGAAVAGDTDGTNLTNILDITGGLVHTCAVSNAGNTYCWGTAANGRLGDNQGATDRKIPVRVLKGAATGADTDGTYLINVKNIDAGGSQTCALSNLGSTYCWGNGSSGKIGDGGTSDRLTPVRVLKGVATGADTNGTNLINIKKIVGGNLQTCAVSNGGKAYCWGGVNVGQVGDNQTATNRTTPVRPEDGAAGSSADQVRFGIDWDMNGSIDQWVPISGYVTAGTEQQVMNNWSSEGVKNFQILAEDDEGAQSGWRSYTITITDPNTPPSTATISGTSTVFVGTNHEFGFNATDTISTITTSVDQALAYSAPQEAFAGFGQWSGVRYRGMGFTPSQSNIVAIAFDIDQLGTKGLKIYIDSANSNSIPDHTPGNALYSWVVPNSEVHFGSAPYYLPAPLTVTPGNQYVMYYASWDTGSDTYADDYRDMTWRNNDAYAGGKPVRNDNGVWSVSDSGNLDQVFATYAQVTSFVDDQIRYGIDWDNDGDIVPAEGDEWVPAAGYVVSGTQASTTHVWNSVGSGSYTFQARAQDDEGKFSANWTSFVVNVGNRPPVATIINPPSGSQPSPVYLRGSFTDDDNDIFDAFEWYDGACVTGTLLHSLSGGPLANPTDSFAQALSVGPHSLFFRVKDARGLWSSTCAQQNMTITAGTQCADGIDNDSPLDGYCDGSSSTCTDGSTPGDPACLDFTTGLYDSTKNDESAKPQCADGTDNNGDGLFDNGGGDLSKAAPSCYDNFNPHTGTYLPFKNSENTCNIPTDFTDPLNPKKKCDGGETFGSCPVDCSDQFKYIEL